MTPEQRLAEVERQVRSLIVNRDEHWQIYEREVRDRFSTLNTPLWKRMVFRVDGWGPWHTVRDAPRWRPWHRWWVS